MKTVELQSEIVIKSFTDHFQSEPAWVSIAPGRVNLLGEHTDYNLLPVLPMTIDRNIRIYGRTRNDGLVRLYNSNGDLAVIEIDLDVPVEPAPGDWSNYVRAALKATLPVLRDNGTKICGFDGLIESDLPLAAGLSSSSALVIASCLALLQANDTEWAPSEVAEQMRLAEHFVGTAGGGMDQAVISLGREGSALLIEFDPLVTTPVVIPSSIQIFIVNSGQKAEKTGSARYSYNRRALECAIAVHLMRENYRNYLDTSGWVTLRDVYASCIEAGLPWSEVIVGALPVDSLRLDTLFELIERPLLEELCSERKLDLANISEWLPGGIFQVYPRAAHVLNEAHRVYQFKTALEQNCTDTVYHLARASHVSCRDLYHISTPELEHLIGTARSCGASAARITGAGFGGCIVAFVPESQGADFPERLVASGVATGNILEAKSTGPARVTNL